MIACGEDWADAHNHHDLGGGHHKRVFQHQGHLAAAERHVHFVFVIGLIVVERPDALFKSQEGLVDFCRLLPSVLLIELCIPFATS